MNIIGTANKNREDQPKDSEVVQSPGLECLPDEVAKAADEIGSISQYGVINVAPDVAPVIEGLQENKYAESASWEASRDQPANDQEVALIERELEDAFRAAESAREEASRAAASASWEASRDQPANDQEVALIERELEDALIAAESDTWYASRDQPATDQEVALIDRELEDALRDQLHHVTATPFGSLSPLSSVESRNQVTRGVLDTRYSRVLASRSYENLQGNIGKSEEELLAEVIRQSKVESEALTSRATSTRWQDEVASSKGGGGRAFSSP